MKLVPWNHDICNEQFDGLFISNGPGDPSLADAAVQNIKKVIIYSLHIEMNVTIK